MDRYQNWIDMETQSTIDLKECDENGYVTPAWRKRRGLVCKTIPYEEQSEIKELRQKQINDLCTLKAFPPVAIDNPNTLWSLDECNKLRSLGTLQPKNKEKNMYRTAEQVNANIAITAPAPVNPEAQARDHLIRRANNASDDKQAKMRQTFGLDDDQEPETLKDFFQRIKDGKYVIPTDETALNRRHWSTSRILEEIRWRDPAVKEDEAGYQAARDKMFAALQDTKDEIIVKTPAEGLESLRAFQAKTFN